MADRSFRCLLVHAGEESPELKVVELPDEQLPPGEVTVQVHWSSVNYKDALAAAGHPGVVRRLPHVPGIDAAGEVIHSNVPTYRPGQPVLVTGYDLGQGHWGGWSTKIRVPSAWVVALPSGLSAREAMIYGTAGFTAAQCVLALQTQLITPESGEVIVTGASGGVGSLALRLLASLGYNIVAVSGKAEHHQRLLDWGAQQVIDRSDFKDEPNKTMLSARWAGGVDTVGGGMLSRMVKETRYGGCIAACGLVAGAEPQLTLYPFLLRGVSLYGIASADCPYDKRLKVWEQLATQWKLANLQELVSEIDLEDLPAAISKMRRGEAAGRILVRPRPPR
jgi:acrylyl-CoA reductase (NADPH)